MDTKWQLPKIPLGGETQVFPEERLYSYKCHMLLAYKRISSFVFEGRQTKTELGTKRHGNPSNSRLEYISLWIHICRMKLLHPNRFVGTQQSWIAAI